MYVVVLLLFFILVFIVFEWLRYNVIALLGDVMAFHWPVVLLVLLEFLILSTICSRILVYNYRFAYGVFIVVGLAGFLFVCFLRFFNDAV